MRETRKLRVTNDTVEIRQLYADNADFHHYTAYYSTVSHVTRTDSVCWSNLMKLHERHLDKQLVSIKQLKVGQAFVDLEDKKCILTRLNDEDKSCIVMYLDPEKTSATVEVRSKEELVQRIALLEISYKAWPLKEKMESASAGNANHVQH